MNTSNYRFVLELHSTQSQISIPVLIGDTRIKLLIFLSDGGKPYLIEDGCLAKISIKRPTGTRLEEFCIIENNSIVVYSFEQHVNTAAVEGIHECDITLYDVDNRVLGSPRFTMIVSERVVRRDDVEITDDDFTAVDAMLAEEARRQVRENQRISAENERISAEEERKASEEERNASEDERKTAEDERISAEEERKSSEEERKSAEEERRTFENQRIANENERVAKDAERDAAINNALDTSGRAEVNSENALNKANRATEAVAEFREEIGTEALIAGQPTIKGSVNYAVSTANSALSQADVVRTNLINLSAQVQGIGRSYVVPDFSYFIDFLNSVKYVELKEDRNGDGAEETYRIYISDLKTGDNIIIVEKGVPDFWFEKNSALTEFDTFPYNGTEHTLSAMVNGAVIGGAHILETDYTVIEGYSTSAAASAKNAGDSALEAQEAEANIDKMVDELYFNQIAPPYEELENSVFLATPAYDML